ncbi:MAG: lysine 2,3-aminomutase [Deltaproteobacteria bacterium]|nr:lysine 2,3-aminomutase [Deltaproteobacteria bacterium]
MTTERPRLRIHQRGDVRSIPGIDRLPAETLAEVEALAWVFPFRVNEYVARELIDWNNAPDDPIYRLTFPHRDMLSQRVLDGLMRLVASGASHDEVRATARAIQHQMNPHPASQLELNVPTLDGVPIRGMQHKYRETVLFFPAQGQTCHTYCSYCFRWAQFVGIEELKIASLESQKLVAYLRAHPEVSSVLFTGGDPMIMRTSVLRRYVEPLLGADLPHLTSIRFGSKAMTYWPYRFTHDEDSDDLMRLFEEVRRSGRQLAFMAHVSHPRELEAPAAQAALRRILDSGASVRCQAPLIRHVNDASKVWSDMWRLQVRLGAIPYYMFVERDTGPKGYFEVPLARAVEIFSDAYRRVSGLARTVRGPSMSATPGKLIVDGVTQIRDERVFVLHFTQARDPSWVGRPFFARFDAHATWLDQLRPVPGESELFFEPRPVEVTRSRKPAPLTRAQRPAARRLTLV